MLTRWLRAFAVVVTDRRLILVRRRKVRPGRPRSLDLAAKLDRVSVVSWRARPSYGTLVLDADGHRLRLHVVGTFSMDVPPVIDALSRPDQS